MLYLDEVQAVGQRGAQLLQRAKHAIRASDALHLLLARALEKRERLLELKAAGGVGHDRGFDPPGGTSAAPSTLTTHAVQKRRTHDCVG